MEKIRDGKTGRFEEDGRVSYYKDGLLHREEGPAREWPNGDKLWFLNDKLHRVDGPAHDTNNLKIWYLNGVLHRDDGPAFEHERGRKEWIVHGKHHREDGPAVEDSIHGDEWWFDDVRYPSQKEFPGNRVKLIKRELSKLNLEQLELLSDFVQQAIALNNSPNTKDRPKPKI